MFTRCLCLISYFVEKLSEFFFIPSRIIYRGMVTLRSLFGHFFGSVTWVHFLGLLSWSAESHRHQILCFFFWKSGYQNLTVIYKNYAWSSFLEFYQKLYENLSKKFWSHFNFGVAVVKLYLRSSWATAKAGYASDVEFSMDRSFFSGGIDPALT